MISCLVVKEALCSRPRSAAYPSKDIDILRLCSLPLIIKKNKNKSQF